MSIEKDLKEFYKKVYQLNLEDDKSEIAKQINLELERNILSLKMLKEKNGQYLSEDFNKSLMLLELEKEKNDRNIIDKKDNYKRYEKLAAEYFVTISNKDNDFYDLELRFSPLNQVNKNVLRLLLTELKKDFDIKITKDEDLKHEGNRGILQNPCADIEVKIKSSDYIRIYNKLDNKLLLNDFDLFFQPTLNSEKFELRKHANFLTEYLIERLQYFKVLNINDSILNKEEKQSIELNINGVVKRPEKTRRLTM